MEAAPKIRVKYENHDDKAKWKEIEKHHGYKLLENLGEGSFG